MHDGRVHVASDGPGLSSEFTVRLPGVGPGEAAEEAAAPSAMVTKGSGAGRRILGVGDQPDSTDSLAMFLRLRGHEVQTAHDGPGALEEIARGCPEVVFLDLGLPGMSGYDVARQIPARADTRDLRLGAVTGYATQARPAQRRRRGAARALAGLAAAGCGPGASRVKSRAAGFDVHLAKPVDPQVLDVLIAR